MDEIRLPHHVVDRFERRWTARFAQMLKGMPPPVARCSHAGGDPIPSPQVRRLLEASFRPPEPRTLEFGGA
jgi:hypothetical protein